MMTFYYDLFTFNMNFSLHLALLTLKRLFIFQNTTMKLSTIYNLLFIFFFVVAANSLSIPLRTTITLNHTSLILNDVQTYYYNQLLDHFNNAPGRNTKFQQRYFVNFKYWGGASSNAPILVLLGGESTIDDIPEVVGFMTENAASFKALLVYIEHRFYGSSVPFDSKKELNNTLGYLNSAQALEDYAALLIHLKYKLHAQKSPVIVVGGSYSGMLAAWFRLKYPHITIGALASSAPILYFDNLTPENAYFDVITRDFKETSETCYEVILNSWNVIDKIASQPNGLSVLSNKFNTCYPLEHTDELKDYLRFLYNSAAQYSSPLVRNICKAIDGAAFGSDILSRIYGGVVAYYGNNTCKVNPTKYDVKPFYGWYWQICSEIVMPIGIGNSSMFQPKPFNFKSYAKKCMKDFGVIPRPHWITAYYGGHNIKLVLQKFGSNIIFSNGLRDPYSSGGVLNDISDSLVALPTVNGTHCMDILAADEDDPSWLVEQRKKEVMIIHRWIREYYDANDI